MSSPPPPSARPSFAVPLSVRPPDEAPAIDLGSVLRAEEVSRTRVFYRAVIGIVLLTACFTPLLEGPVWLRVLAGALCVAIAIIAGTVLVVLQQPERYTPRIAAAIAVLLAVMAVVIIYYVGLFSAGAMTLTLGVYFFGMSHSRLVARTALAAVSGCYFVASAGVAASILPDLSLFSTDNAAVFTRWFQVFMSQVIFGFTFYLARSSRRATEAAVDRVHQANLQIKRRDALLAEARGELDRALRPLDGRHSGETIGDYTLEEVLGRGAMGEVYRAKKSDGSGAAVKLLHANLIDDPDHIKRFLREAEAAAAVKSPHVPAIYDIGWAKHGTPYIVMELLEGHDLGWHLRQNARLSLDLVVELVEHVSEALSAVRDAGVVHRDLKPGNLFLTDSLPRNWKVLDFGLSKILWSGSSLTKDVAVGTPSYMAPEQIKGPAVDHQSDLYALASIAYRAITGTPTFSGDQIAHTLFNVLYAQPANPSDFVKVPVDIELVLAIGLAKSREDRFERVEDFASALRAAARGELADDHRQRGWALLKAYPWGSSRKPSATRRTEKRELSSWAS